MMDSMSRPRFTVLSVFVLVLMLFCRPLLASGRVVVQLDLRGTIGPAASDYVHDGLARARALNAALVVLRMDTPGGLDLAMRRIIRDILASPVPVAGFVAPSGARAASAGTYILYACSIAAMAPATNLGAATPVEISTLPGTGRSAAPAGGKAGVGTATESTETRKMVNDAAAYIRGLAQLRGRNATWAVAAVRRAASLPAREALRAGVINLIARSVPDLVKQVNGLKVELAGSTVTLHTAGARIVRIRPGWRNHLLSVIGDPTMAYILMLLGIYGLFFEMWHPGLLFPGIIGVVCLLLALFAFQLLPVSLAGIALLLLGIGLMVAEVFLPTLGVLGLGGAAAFAAGSVMILDAASPGYGASWLLVGGVTVLSAAFFLTVASLALRARRRPVVSGREQMIGASGEALAAFDGDGRVHVHGEEWQAHASRPVTRGQKIRVVGMEGLVLQVEPNDDEEAG